MFSFITLWKQHWQIVAFELSEYISYWNVTFVKATIYIFLCIGVCKFSVPLSLEKYFESLIWVSQDIEYNTFLVKKKIFHGKALDIKICRHTHNIFLIPSVELIAGVRAWNNYLPVLHTACNTGATPRNTYSDLNQYWDD